MKKTLYLLFTLIVTFCIIPKASAASLSVSASKSTVTVGSSVTVTVRGNGVTGRINVSSSNSGVLSGGGSKWVENGSASFTFSAKKVGNATITASASDASDSNGNTFSGSKSITINVAEPDNRSTNNSLKSLSVEGQTLSPEFNASTTNYNLGVPYDVKSIKIKAEAADSKSKVAGTGEKSLKTGNNKFDITVTAENGSKKTYTINVEVDTKPIEVKVNGKKVSVVKKKEELPELLVAHEDTTLNIDEQDVPAYRIDKLGYILVGLKDSKGKVKLYKFDSKKGDMEHFTYTLFEYVISPGIYIAYLDFPKKLIPDNYKKYKEDINGEKVDIYKLGKDSRYGLFYGTNMGTGKKAIYKYDTKEGTIQAYDKSEVESLVKQMDVVKSIIIGLIALSGLLFIIIVLMIMGRKRKIKKALRKYIEKYQRKEGLMN